MQVTIHSQRACGVAPISSRASRPAARRAVRLAVAEQNRASLNGTPPAAAAPAAAKPQGAAAAAAPAKQAGFTNTNRFVVDAAAMPAFRQAWQEREAYMKQFNGFLGFSLAETEGAVMVSSQWASIPDWEVWSLSPECRRSHLPPGVWQYVPRKGEGFPEDFVPLLSYDEAVNAKY